MKNNTKKTEIIKAASRLFSEHGYEMVSMQQIASAVNSNVALIYHYFDSKDDLLDDVLVYIGAYLQHYRISADDILKDLDSGKTPRQILMPFLTYYDRYSYDEWQRFMRFFFTGTYYNWKIANAAVETLLRPLVSNISYALNVLSRLGEIPPGNHQCLAKLWVSTWLAHDFADPGDKENPEIHRSNMMLFIEMAVRGIYPYQGEITARHGIYSLAKALELPDTTTKERIVKESLRLFSERGYNNVTNRQIAEAAGVQSSSVIYKYFSSKSELMQALIETQLQGVAQYNKSRPTWEFTATGSSPLRLVFRPCACHPPICDEQVLHTCRLIFRNHYYSKQVKDFFVSFILSDCQRLTDYLIGRSLKETALPYSAQAIAAALTFGVCGVIIAQSINPGRIIEFEQMRKDFVLTMVSLIMHGFIE